MWRNVGLRLVRKALNFRAGMLGLAFAAAFAGPCAAETIELKLSHFLPGNSPAQAMFERWAADLKSKSSGRLNLTVFPSGTMGPPARQFDLVRSGVADLAFVHPGFMPGRFRLSEVPFLPFLFTKDGKPLTNAAASSITTTLGEPLANEYIGTRVLYFVSISRGALFFKTRKVQSLADMKGLRVRHNGPITAAALTAWGATPVAVQLPEISDALAKGTIDGLTFSFEAAQTYRIEPVIKAALNLNASGALFVLTMNDAKYKSLPQDLRRLIDTTTGVAAAREMGAAYDRAEDAGLHYLRSHGIDIVDPSPDAISAFRRATEVVVRENLDKLGPVAKALHDKFVQATASWQ